MGASQQIWLPYTNRPPVLSGGVSTNQGSGALPGWTSIGVQLDPNSAYYILASSTGVNPPPFLASGFLWASTLNGHAGSSLEIRITKIGGVLNLDTGGGSLTTGVYYNMGSLRSFFVDGAAGQEFLGTMDVRDAVTLVSYGSQSFVLHCT